MKIKIVVIILSLLLKNKNKDAHYNTHNIQIKKSVLFSGTTGIFSRSIQEIE